jgi:hypothetical protein
MADSLTEGLKHDADKLRFDLLPVKPLELVAEVYTIGAKKYEDRNWEKGLKWGRVFGALMRHAWAWWRGERKDQKDGQHHLASVCWCALALMEYEDTHPELDDRPRHTKSFAQLMREALKNQPLQRHNDIYAETAERILAANVVVR